MRFTSLTSAVMALSLAATDLAFVHGPGQRNDRNDRD